MIALAHIFQVIFLVLAAAGITGGVILVWREIHQAPEGHEDRGGYHTDRRSRP